jgi:hypothetical protein
MSIIAVLVLLGLLGTTRMVAAAGRGGTISLGAASGNTVEVDTTAAADGWSGYNIHVTTRGSPGVALTRITATQGAALPGQGFCASTVPVTGEYVSSCVGLESQSVTAAGSLAKVTVAATGNGCIGVSLVSAPGDTTLGTYTIDSATSTAQAVTVSTATAKILVGAGTAAACPTMAYTTTPTLAAPSASATAPTLAPPPATATTPTSAIGGQLSVGTPLGKNATGLLVVPIDTTAATDAYYGYAVHLEFDGSLIDAVASDVTPTFGGSTLDAGGVPGFDAEVGALDSHSIAAAAWKAGGQSTTLAGTLTHVWLKPRPGAAGCSYLHLVTLGAPDGGTGTAGPPSSLAFTGSYTINAGDGRPQQNSYGPDAGIDVQTGTACTASAPALPRSGTGGARDGGRPLLVVAAMLCSLAAGTVLVMAGRVARRRRLS